MSLYMTAATGRIAKSLSVIAAALVLNLLPASRSVEAAGPLNAGAEPVGFGSQPALGAPTLPVIGPDLTVSGEATYIATITNPQDPTREARLYSLNLSITNRGTLFSNATELAVGSSRFPVPVLRAGDRAAVTGMAVRSYGLSLVAIVDPENLVRERNESNNSLTLR